MHRLLLTASCASVMAFATTSALAAPAQYDWTGVYVGGHAGEENTKASFGAFTEQVQQLSNVNVAGDDTHAARGLVVVPATSVSFAGGSSDNSAGMGGGQLGYAQQIGRWVLGGEVDVDTDSKEVIVETTSALPATTLMPASTIEVQRSLRAGRRWSVRARVGYTWDRLQVYATGGIAGAKLNVYGQDTFINPGGAALPVTLPAPSTCCVTVVTQAFSNITTGRTADERVGWTLGGGVEWALFDHVSFGVEYRHTDLGKRTYDVGTLDTRIAPIVISPPVGSVVTAAIPAKGILSPTTVSYSNDAVTARVNVHFW